MKRAVIIAISYRNTPDELAAPLHDGNRMQELLLREGYERNNILVLSENGGVTPTHRNILQSWKWLYTTTPAASYRTDADYFPSANVTKAVVYYSGHGMQITDRNGDEDDGKDECLVPLDYKTYGVLTDDVINAHLVLPLPVTTSLFVLFDACNSGSGCDLPWNYYRYRAPDTYTVFHDKYPDTEKTVCCIAAALDSELAYEIGNVSTLTSRFLNCYKRGEVLKVLIKMMQEEINTQTFVLSTSRSRDLDLQLSL